MDSPLEFCLGSTSERIAARPCQRSPAARGGVGRRPPDDTPGRRVSDVEPRAPGPLLGLVTALEAARCDHVLVLPLAHARLAEDRNSLTDLLDALAVTWLEGASLDALDPQGAAMRAISTEAALRALEMRTAAAGRGFWPGWSGANFLRSTPIVRPTVECVPARGTGSGVIL